MKNLKDLMVCPKKAYYQEKMNLDLDKNKRVQFKVCLRRLLKEKGMDGLKDAAEVAKYFEPYLDCSLLKEERKRCLNSLTFKLKRLSTSVSIWGLDIVDYDVTISAPFFEQEGIQNKVKFDFIAKNVAIKNSVNFVGFNIKENKSNYAKSSTAAKSILNDESKYAEYLALQSLYPNSYVAIGVIPLQGRTEKISEDISLAWDDLLRFDEVSIADFTNSLKTTEKKEKDELLESFKKIRWKESIVPKTEKKEHCGMCDFCQFCGYEADKAFGEFYYDEEDDSSALKKLRFTPVQERFINEHRGYIRVIASAGSGKTTCITNRVRSIIQKGSYDTNDLLLITFTDKGCMEMKAKLAKALNQAGIESKPSDFNVFTFNSFGHKIILENLEELGFTEEPSLIDELTVIEIMKDILDNLSETFDSLNYENPLLKAFQIKGAVLKLAEQINHYTTMKETPYEPLILYPNPSNDVRIEVKNQKITQENISISKQKDLFLEVYKLYKQAMKDRNLIDYEDQLHMALNLIKTNSEIAKMYSYEHILVDEAQDTSLDQFEILETLINTNGVESFVVCGDDAQAIYGFRGVDMRYLLDFDKKFKNVKDFKLLDNFRSTKEIIEVADFTISLSSQNLKKAMIGHKHGQPIKVVSYDKRASANKGKRLSASAIREFEVKEVLTDIQKTVAKEKYPLSEIAVIGRRKTELIEISKELDRLGIPNVGLFPTPFIDSLEVKAVQGLLNMMCNDLTDELAIVSYLQIFKPDTYILSSDLKYTSLLEAGMIKEDIIEMNEEEQFIYFKEIVYKNKIKSVVALIESFQSKGLKTIPEMYQQLKDMFLYKSDESYNVYEKGMDAVVLTTAHSSKGLEWQHVALMMSGLPDITGFYSEDFNDFSLPTDFRFTFDSEEIRLLFVAVTRAKEELTLIS